MNTSIIRIEKDKLDHLLNEWGDGDVIKRLMNQIMELDLGIELKEFYEITEHSIRQINEKKLKECLPELNKCKNSEKQKIICVELDINNVDSMKNIFNKIVKDNSLKNIDTLINNAGVAIGGIIGTTKEEEFDKTITTNLKGTYFLSQEFANYLIKENIQGNILNISSVSGIRPAITPYMLSKHSLIGLTEGLAKKLIKYGIVVNGIAPGPTVTDMIGVKGNDLYYQNSPAQRYVDPVEVANLAVYLISKMGKMIVGDTVYISGGCGNLTRDDIMY